MATKLDFASFRMLYDDLTKEIEVARPQFFTDHLENWFEHIDSTPGVRDVVKRLQAVAFMKSIGWFEEIKKWPHGPEQYPKWPQGRELRLGLQLTMFREMAKRSLQASEFAKHFLRNEKGDTRQVIEEIFVPMARDLRRKLERELDDHFGFREIEEPPEAAVPASDRTVSLDHNSSAYQETIEALDRLEHTLVKANDYPDLEDKEQRIAEVSALRRLFNSTKVRVGTVAALAGPTLQYLAKKFVDTGIGKAASAAIEKITALLGSLF